MTESEHRQISRDSLFVMAELRLEGVDDVQRVKVRNLSSGGLMAEGATGIARGQLVSIQVRNVGWVEGSIAWVQGVRCGIAFREEIDPRVARMTLGSGEAPPRFTRPPLDAVDATRLRKI